MNEGDIKSHEIKNQHNTTAHHIRLSAQPVAYILIHIYAIIQSSSCELTS